MRAISAPRSQRASISLRVTSPSSRMPLQRRDAPRDRRRPARPSAATTRSAAPRARPVDELGRALGRAGRRPEQRRHPLGVGGAARVLEQQRVEEVGALGARAARAPGRCACRSRTSAAHGPRGWPSVMSSAYDRAPITPERASLSLHVRVIERTARELERMLDGCHIRRCPFVSRDMRILVAGATGAIGKQLVPALAAAGHDVTALVRSAEVRRRFARSARSPCTATRSTARAVIAAVRAARPDVIVHQLTALAGSLDLRRFDRSFAATNQLRTEGTDHLLAAAWEVGVHRVVAGCYAGWPSARSGGPVTTEERPARRPPARWRCARPSRRSATWRRRC